MYIFLILNNLTFTPLAPLCYLLHIWHYPWGICNLKYVAHVSNTALDEQITCTTQSEKF